MSFDRVMGLLSLAGMALMGAIFLPKLLAPDSAIYRDLLTPEAILFIAAPVKLVFLLIAAIYACRSAASFESTNPVRTAWTPDGARPVGIRRGAVRSGVLPARARARRAVSFASPTCSSFPRRCSSR